MLLVANVRAGKCIEMSEMENDLFGIEKLFAFLDSRYYTGLLS